MIQQCNRLLCRKPATRYVKVRIEDASGGPPVIDGGFLCDAHGDRLLKRARRRVLEIVANARLG